VYPLSENRKKNAHEKRLRGGLVGALRSSPGKKKAPSGEQEGENKKKNHSFSVERGKMAPKHKKKVDPRDSGKRFGTGEKKKFQGGELTRSVSQEKKGCLVNKTKKKGPMVGPRLRGVGGMRGLGEKKKAEL